MAGKGTNIALAVGSITALVGVLFLATRVKAAGESPEPEPEEELSIISATWQPAPAQELLEYTLAVKVKNTGGVGMGNVNLIMDADIGTTPVVANFSIGEMAIGESRQVSETFMFSPGTHSMTVYLESGGVVWDKREFTFEIAEISGLGNLHGTIKDADTGELVVNAHVAIGCYFENMPGHYFWCADDFFDGEYCFGLEPDRYVVWCIAPGYQERYYNNFLVGINTKLDIDLQPKLVVIL